MEKVFSLGRSARLHNKLKYSLYDMRDSAANWSLACLISLDESDADPLCISSSSLYLRATEQRATKKRWLHFSQFSCVAPSHLICFLISPVSVWDEFSIEIPFGCARLTDESHKSFIRRFSFIHKKHFMSHIQLPSRCHKPILCYEQLENSRFLPMWFPKNRQLQWTRTVFNEALWLTQVFFTSQ